MLTNSKVLWRKNNRWKAERYQGGARIVRVDLRKMTFGQRLEYIDEKCSKGRKPVQRP